MKWGNNQDIHRDHVIAAIRVGGALQKLDDKGDSRIIPGGRFLRKACLDELPQLLNVLRGEMSLVGPRPCMPYEAEEYSHWHRQRFNVMPGMTGLWQVSGKNKLNFDEMVSLDLEYANKMSFFFDLKILLLTAPAIIILVFGKGVEAFRAKMLNPALVSVINLFFSKIRQ
jgi:lipopolysaccharide/colanic/teichoic acid biosynthesis glycosyltransferase